MHETRYINRRLYLFQVDARNSMTGEIVFKDNFNQAVAGIVEVSQSVVELSLSSVFFFVSQWNRAIFWPSVLHVALYKTLFFDF